MGRERNVTDVSDGTVLNTFHYTRTYLDGGILGRKRGDSGRVWGYGKVNLLLICREGRTFSANSRYKSAKG